ncbi:helix-turn-helix domain-containing protein [Bacillus mycoides]|uniref:helix-turn-helix domain-containing protein n=1 Tax=Bacillus mycoides TaxID=1405 RepID=UPI003D1F842A
MCNQCSKYKWTGNMRNVNVILLQKVMGNQKQIELQNGNKEKRTLNFHGKLQCYSMIEALEKTTVNVSLAAKLFAVPRSTFYKRMQKFRL